jgi:hypothetical protein
MELTDIDPPPDEITDYYDPNTYEGQANILLECIDNDEKLSHWIWEQDFFEKEGYDDNGNSLYLNDEEIANYLTKAGHNSSQIDKILNIIHMEG